MFSDSLRARATALLDRYRNAGERVATAESCTGGLVAGLLTEISGSSDVFDRAFVVYSNAAKMAMLGVPAALLAEHGAVSEPVARAMAAGAISRSAGSVAVAITGIAGPGGGGPAKPVGLVHLACISGKGGTVAERHIFAGGRTVVRLAAVDTAIRLLEST